MDKLGSHKGSAVRKAIRAARTHLLFRPPCSPDLNAIEQVFAKLEHLMRTASERSVDAVWKRIGYPTRQLLNAVMRKRSAKSWICLHLI
jgi:transposase